MRIIQIISVLGIVLFFPLYVGRSTCLLGYLNGWCISGNLQLSSEMLTHYIRLFAIPWWLSIAAAIWTTKKLKTQLKIK